MSMVDNRLSFVQNFRDGNSLLGFLKRIDRFLGAKVKEFLFFKE